MTVEYILIAISLICLLLLITATVLTLFVRLGKRVRSLPARLSSPAVYVGICLCSIPGSVFVAKWALPQPMQFAVYRSWQEDSSGVSLSLAIHERDASYHSPIFVKRFGPQEIAPDEIFVLVQGYGSLSIVIDRPGWQTNWQSGYKADQLFRVASYQAATVVLQDWLAQFLDEEQSVLAQEITSGIDNIELEKQWLAVDFENSPWRRTGQRISVGFPNDLRFLTPAEFVNISQSPWVYVTAFSFPLILCTSLALLTQSKAAAKRNSDNLQDEQTPKASLDA